MILLILVFLTARDVFDRLRKTERLKKRDRLKKRER